MTRFEDWQERLHAYLDTVQHAPFVYGENDCALHGANAVLAMTGEDHGAPFRGKYKSAAGSVRALKRHGAGDIPWTFTAACGDPIPSAFAGRGDLVLNDGSVGVCMGGFAWFVGEENGAPGLVRIERPVSGWSMAWQV